MIDPESRPEPPLAGDPVTLVGAFLDFQRATLLWKIDGLDEETLRRPLVASGTSLLGIVKHSAYVERFWFQIVTAGRAVTVPWPGDDDWRIGEDESAASIVAFYERECAISREIAAGLGWDAPVANDGNGRRAGMTLGWVMAHMLEEISRHVGQVDILREQLDGLVGE